jgi:predicted RNase H-like HicB family nuclease
MKDAKHYASLLPQRLSVKIEKDEKGFWATILDLPHCYTQASTGSELLEMINDAVQTHFEVPEKFRNEIGYYVPLTDEHQKLEGMFRKLVEIEHRVSEGHEVKTTLNLASEVC